MNPPKISDDLQIIYSPTLNPEDFAMLFDNPAQFLYNEKVGQRAGIIPYYIEKNTGMPVYFVGYAMRKYSDFGGGCNKRETIMQCALREYTEETRGVLGLQDGVLTHIYVTGKKRPHQLILMVNVPNISKDINTHFQNTRARNMSEKEMERLELLGLGDLYSLFFSFKLSDSLTSLFKLIAPNGVL